jgi:RNA polymerase sigma-70 factor (sigma-E family)
VEAVMAMSRAGEGPDFAVFVRANTAALLRTAYLLTGSAAAAEDLVQETLTRLYPKWSRVEQAEKPLAYVRRCLANNFVNATRRKSNTEVAVEFLPEHADGTDSATTLAERDEVWRMLTTLTERQRAALVLRYFHDLPDDEIADALGCRVGTVRSAISRGLAALRTAEEVAR